MARSESSNERAHQLNLLSANFGADRKELTGNLTLTHDSPFSHFFDCGSADRTITLPSFFRGRAYIFGNYGANNSLLVRDSSGALIATVSPNLLTLVECSGNEWRSTPSVFNPAGVGHGVGLVPDPGAVAGLIRFLSDDGTWKSVTSAGIVDAYKTMSDGTNTASASGLSQFRFRSADSSITSVITDNDGTFGDVLNYVVNPANVNHNLLQNYAANQHIDHTTVSISAGTGLTGGGTIAASRTISLDINGLTIDTPVLADSIAFYDLSGADINKATFTVINSILDHNALTNYSSNQHIDHTTVSINAGSGLTGGGTIAATRTISLDINGLSVDAPVLADSIAFYDLSGGDVNKTTLTTLNGVFDLRALFNYVANEHINHTSVSISAGTGLTGGGDLTATRTLSLATIANNRVMANVSGGTQEPSATTITALLDALIGNVRGNLAVRASAAWQALGIGASGTVLSSNGTDPSWVAGVTAPVTAAQGGTGTTTNVAHGVLLGEGTSAVVSLVGLAGQTLQGGGTGADPTWTYSLQLGATGISGGALLLFGLTANRVGLKVPASVTADYDLTFPAAVPAGSGALLTSTSGGVLSWSEKGQIPGTATNDSASAGNIGETIAGSAAINAVTLTSGAAGANVLASPISLTAGNWLISGVGYFSAGATTTMSDIVASISLVSGTHDFTVGRFSAWSWNAQVIGANASINATIPPFRLSLSATTSVYLVATGDFGVSTLKVGGAIQATRCR